MPSLIVYLGAAETAVAELDLRAGLDVDELDQGSGLLVNVVMHLRCLGLLRRVMAVAVVDPVLLARPAQVLVPSVLAVDHSSKVDREMELHLAEDYGLNVAELELIFRRQVLL